MCTCAAAAQETSIRGTEPRRRSRAVKIVLNRWVTTKRRIGAAALLLGVILTAGLLAATADADAAIKTKRCAWWNLDNDDELVIDALGNSTTCRTARKLGDAYLDHSRWFPRTLYAAGRTWRLYGNGDYSGEWRYRSMQYRAYTSTGLWQSVYLTYQW